MPKQFLLPILASVGLGASFWLSPLTAAPPAVPIAGSSALIAEITAQQELVVANQTKIDTTLAEVKEEMRLARLFSARSGGKATTP